MGKHHETGQVVHLVLSKKFGRALSACFIAVLAIFAFGFQGPVPDAQTNGQPLAMGEVGPGLLPTSDPTSAPRTISPSVPSSAPVPAANTANVSFERSSVQTLDKNGAGNLNVASSSLDRPGAGKLYAPLETLIPSSPFGLRIDPITGLPGEFHWGQDFAAACGTLVYAADSGVVRAVGWHPWGGGNRVEIDHGNGLVTTYNHLQGIAVVKGQSVRVGQVIARVGTTGSSTGCHLHFETIVDGVYTNPMNWSFLPTKQVDPLGALPMVSYQPGSATATSPGSVWSIPGAVPTESGAAAPAQPVAGGAQEAAVAAPTVVAPSTAATAPPSPSTTATPTPTPSRTTTPTPSRTASPSATPTPTATATATPSRSTTATPSTTPTPSPSATATPSTTKPSPSTTQSGSATSQAPSSSPVVTQAPVVTHAPVVTQSPVVTQAPVVAPTAAPVQPAPVPSAPVPAVPSVPAVTTSATPTPTPSASRSKPPA